MERRFLLWIVVSCGGCASEAETPVTATPGASVAATGMIVFQDPGESTPAGWVCLSCQPGDPFYQRFPLGAPTEGAVGGSATHAHAVTLSASSGASESTGVIDVGEDIGYAADEGHQHGASGGVSGVGGNLPWYRNLKVIGATTPTRILPRGAVIMLSTGTVPTDFERYTAQDGYFIRGEGAVGTGGAPTHGHSIAVQGATYNGGYAASNEGNNCAAAATTHFHWYSTTAAPASNEPVHAVVVLARVSHPQGAIAPVGTVSLFHQIPNANWQSLSGSGAPLNGSFLRAGTAPNFSQLGGNTHSHPTATVTSGYPSAYQNFRGHGGCGGDVRRASAGHVHQATLAYAATDHRPPFRTAVIAVKTRDDFGDNGEACTLRGECASGFCEDGVCCASSCGACGQCNVPASVGTCAIAVADTVCGPVDGECDLEDRCDGTSSICPERVRGRGTLCDPTRGTRCDGLAAACGTMPADGIREFTASCEIAVPCGDRVCGDGEDCHSCSADCGDCAPECSDHECNGSENCTTCPGDCGACGPLCDNGVCDVQVGESCATCPQDCQCPPRCGDRACNGGETCGSCPLDCGVCPSVCGDSRCEGTENCGNCPDCRCTGAARCEANDCTLWCGNGQCDAAGSSIAGGHEDPCNCPSDCAGTCCGNRTCEPSGGETCETCSDDCGCPIFTRCEAAGECNNWCGNGRCDPSRGEDCGNCPDDCGCAGPFRCEENQCVLWCGNGMCEGFIGENCVTCRADCACAGPEYSCNVTTRRCVPHCGNWGCQPDEGENCTTCPTDCSCGDGNYCDDSNSCRPRCGNGSCEPEHGESCGTCLDCDECPDCELNCGPCSSCNI